MKSLVLSLLIIKCIAAQQRVDPIVTTPKGQIRGLPAQDGDYDMFLGIPYALVDENDPFGPAIPHPGFDTPFEATTGGVMCLQASYDGVDGTLQCLQLDVHVPKTASATNRLPVIFHIHGGGFVTGDKGILGPKFLMKHDVIIVNMNYRLNVYGFMCTSENRYKNQGLKDQVLAMEWVKENIESFGGDINSITMLGLSAGAMSIDLHLLAIENFAHKAIIMSGPALSIWTLAPENNDIPIDIAKELGYNTTNVKDALEFLVGIDPVEVVTVADRIGIMRSASRHPLTTPCVEPVSDDAFLTDYPINMQPKVKGMDIMIGHTNKEAMFIYPKSDDISYYEKYEFAVELATDFTEVLDVDTVRHFYIGDDEINEKVREEILDYASDLAFVYPTIRSTNKYIAAGARNVYNYMFSYEGDRNIMRMVMNHTTPGACHGDDIAYLFEVPEFVDVTPSEEDQELIDVMTKMWTDFIKEGNPTPDPSQLPFNWSPVTDSQRRPYLSIDRRITLENRVFSDRMAFWELYYELHGDKIMGVRP